MTAGRRERSTYMRVQLPAQWWVNVGRFLSLGTVPRSWRQPRYVSVAGSRLRGVDFKPGTDAAK